MTLTTLAPDRFNRFFFAARYLRVACPYGFTSQKILDMGSCENLLATFLDNHPILQLDQYRDEASGTFIQSRAENTPLRDRSMDFVVCLDMLEHNPVSIRPIIIQEIARITADTAIIAFPADHVFNVKNEAMIAELYRSLHGKPYRFLLEHYENGLVDSEQTLRDLAQYFPYTQKFFTFSLPIWCISHIIDSFLGFLPETRPIRDSLFKSINHIPALTGLESDAYRTFIIASHHPILPFGDEDLKLAREDYIDHGVTAAIVNAHGKLDQLHKYAIKLEVEIQAISKSFSELETHYLNTQVDLENHRKLRLNLEKSLADLSAESLRLHSELDQKRAIQEEYDRLETYSLHLEKLVIDKDRQITELQEKITNLIVQFATRNKTL